MGEFQFGFGSLLGTVFTALYNAFVELFVGYLLDLFNIGIGTGTEA